MSVDFFIVTDIPYDKLLSSNVYMINKSLEQVKDLASEKLGFKVSLDYAYKLCDFKPAYGLIFSDILEKYDFWAQSDIDVIYGNIRSFMDYDMLHYYDFVSVRHDFATGVFALYRNNDLMNNLFKKSADYIKVFSNDEHFCFDECNHVHPLLEDGSRTIFDVETDIQSFTHVVKIAEKEGIIKSHFDFIIMEGITGKVKFNKGAIIYKNKYEALLYHLIKMKAIYNPGKAPKVISDTYNISSKRIYNIKH